jgi:predicted ribosome quality control (RQC) complex YloA/Tae2 family protein
MMQPLDALTLQHLGQDLATQLVGGRVNKIQQPSRDEFLFYIRQGGQSHRLYVSIQGSHPCCFLLPEAEVQEKVVEASPQDALTLSDWVVPTLSKPTGFCMLLRKYLGVGVLQSIQSIPGERVLNCFFQQENELGHAQGVMLSFELMGKYSNLILVEPKTQTILGASHQVTEGMSRYREVSTGLPYLPPPQPVGKIPILALTADDLMKLPELAELDVSKLDESNLDLAEPKRKPPSRSFFLALSQITHGVGVQMAQNIFKNFGTSPPGEELFTLGAYLHVLQHLAQGHPPQPGISKHPETYTLWAEGPDWQESSSVSLMVSQYYSQGLRRQRMHQLRGELLRKLKALEDKATKRQQSMAPPSSVLIEHWQHIGDLLLSHPTVLDQSPSQLIVEDYLHPEDPITIDIQPEKSMQENAQRYYQKARKAKTQRDYYQKQLDKIQAEKEYSQHLIQLVTQAETLPELLSLQDELRHPMMIVGGDASSPMNLKESDFAGAMGAHPSQSSKKGGRKKGFDAKGKNKGKEKGKSAKKPDAFSGVQVFHTPQGDPIYVGKTGEANGNLVGKIAKSHDVWFHVHQMPGSHVLVRGPLESLSDETLLMAGQLAAYYSSARGSLNVPVNYTQMKYVRKIPGSYPGHVQYREEKTIHVSPGESLFFQGDGNSI